MVGEITERMLHYQFPISGLLFFGGCQVPQLAEQKEIYTAIAV
jgi:hypothetical protein